MTPGAGGAEATAADGADASEGSEEAKNRAANEGTARTDGEALLMGPGNENADPEDSDHKGLTGTGWNWGHNTKQHGTGPGCRVGPGTGTQSASER